MRIEHVSIDQIRPYAKNPRRNDQAVDRVAQSIQEFGFNQPIVIDQEGTIVVGHTRFKAAKRLKLTQVPVLRLTEVSPDKLQAYRIADNKLNELAEWDDDLLISELEAIVAAGNEQLTGFTADELRDLLDSVNPDNAYTQKIEIPHYTPKGDRPDIADLYDDTHRDRLLRDIESSQIPSEVKAFLRAAADRHRVFDYHQIAEYYCHADPAVQRLMEQSALVIIDINQAIEQGYVALTDELRAAYAEDHPNAG